MLLATCQKQTAPYFNVSTRIWCHIPGSGWAPISDLVTNFRVKEDEAQTKQEGRGYSVWLKQIKALDKLLPVLPADMDDRIGSIPIDSDLFLNVALLSVFWCCNVVVVQGVGHMFDLFSVTFKKVTSRLLAPIYIFFAQTSRKTVYNHCCTKHKTCTKQIHK